MFLLTAALLIGAGIILGKVLHTYWERITSWLNNDVANMIEEHLGIGARKGLLKAVSTASRAFRWVDGKSVATNTSLIFTEVSGGEIIKATVENHVSEEQLGNEYLEELRTARNVLDISYAN
jgi:hypothetical protein